MALPPVSAARRAPRRPFTRPLTASRWRSAVVRPGAVAIPSESISTTPSNASRERSRYGQARRESAKSRSRWMGPALASATSCCARMSSGASGMRIRSSRPPRTPRTSAALSTSSSRLMARRTGRGRGRLVQPSDGREWKTTLPSDGRLPFVRGCGETTAPQVRVRIRPRVSDNRGERAWHPDPDTTNSSRAMSASGSFSGLLRRRGSSR